MESIADRLAKVRESAPSDEQGSRGFALAIEKRAGYKVTNVTVLAYESAEGTSKIPAEYVAAVAKAFGKNPGWLLTGEGPEDYIMPESEATAKLDQLRKILDMPASAFTPVPKKKD